MLDSCTVRDAYPSRIQGFLPARIRFLQLTPEERRSVSLESARSSIVEPEYLLVCINSLTHQGKLADRCNPQVSQNDLVTSVDRRTKRHRRYYEHRVRS